MLATPGVPLPLLSLAAAAALQVPVPQKPLPLAITAGVMVLAGVGALIGWLRQRLKAGIAATFGGLWIDAPLALLIILHGFGEDWGAFAPNLVILCLVPLWIGDTAGLFVGKALGRHPMAPAISPKKTWEGAIGNLLGCMVGAWLLGEWLAVEPWRWIGVGIATGILGQAGDLFESALKRKSEVKDSGKLLPGHGGLLDRLDSTLMSAIPAALVLLL